MKRDQEERRAQSALLQRFLRQYFDRHMLDPEMRTATRLTIRLTEDQRVHVIEDRRSSVGLLRPWFLAYSGITLAMRYAAYVDPADAQRVVADLSRPDPAAVGGWRFVTACDDYALQVAVETLASELKPTPTCHAAFEVPDGGGPGQWLQPAILMREHLVRARGKAANACREAYELLAKVTEREMHDVLDPSAQVISPLRIMSLLERRRIVPSVVGTEGWADLHASDGKSLFDI